MNNRIPPIPMMLHIIGNIPTSYAMAMSYEEQLLCLKNYLCEIVVPTMNKNIEEIQTLITYINNYFDNLDLQEEVNNKIEEMYENGELQEIITSYLQVNGVLGFNTLSNLVSATNLIDGSICRTLGLNTYNDGKGAFYKIRTITSSDVVDGINIIALNISNTLIAEKMQDYNISNLQSQINMINDEIANIKNKKFILISDSYGTLTNDNTKTWCEEFKNNMNLDNSQVIIKALGGARFSHVSGSTSFEELLTEVDDDYYVTDIIVCGGYNDQGVPYSTLYPAISSFKDYANTHFPNAKISVGFIGKTTNYEYIYNVAFELGQYIRCCKELNINYLNNVQYSLNDSGLCIASDKIHPTDVGQVKLGYNITQSYLHGTCNNYTQYATFRLENNENFTLSPSQNFYLTLNDGIAILGNRTQIGFNNSEGFNFGNGNSNVEIATISSDTSVIGNSYNTITIPVNYLLQNDGVFYTGMGVVTITNKSYKFRPLLCTTNNFRTLNKVTWIQLQPYHHIVDSTMI